MQAQFQATTLRRASHHTDLKLIHFDVNRLTSSRKRKSGASRIRQNHTDKTHLRQNRRTIASGLETTDQLTLERLAQPMQQNPATRGSVTIRVSHGDTVLPQPTSPIPQEPICGQAAVIEPRLPIASTSTRTTTSTPQPRSPNPLERRLPDADT